MIPNLAEIQQRIAFLGVEVQNAQTEIQVHGGTLTSARNRIESIASTLENASKLIERVGAGASDEGDPEKIAFYRENDAELDILREVFQEEVRFWIRRATEASPKLRAAYATFDAKRKELDDYQAQVVPRLVELDAERRAKQPGALGNSPGQVPSMGGGTGQPS